MEPDFNARAGKLIAEGRLAEARTVLDGAIQEMPKGWTPIREEANSVTISFWDQEEFFAYSNQEAQHLSKILYWAGESYPRAWYLLAVIDSKQQRFDQALFSIDCGLELESHPELWSERGYILGRLERHEESLECFVRAATVRNWAPFSQMARALRGQGVQLVDLDRLDEAEAALRQSLEFEPESETARNELGYIADLRRQREAQEKEIPWFLQSFVHPPTDPLTIRLIALVKDLPSIPGPKTVGTDGYSRILDAFMKRGWAGFEEAFDRVVPRARPDYADVKRDLLREPIFGIEAHRNMAEVVLGKKTVDELFDKRALHREPQKPQ